MKISEPIGAPVWAAFFVRFALGWYLFIQGYHNLGKVPQIVEEVKSFNVVPIHLAQLYGSLLPYLAVAAGFLMIIGLWTTLAALVSSLMIASFVWAFKDYPTAIGSQPPTDSIILLFSSLSLLYSGAGACSIDNLRKGGGDK